ncbi:MAG: hypothetical protein IT371_23675 [Deltaproteobacteria bacterium]|nr:hypothetical protein [Deltaproteobacteria bacterium]
MEPFSEEHLALVHPWPDDARAQRAGLERWFRVAQHTLLKWTQGSRHLLTDEERRDAFQWACLALHERLVRGWLSKALSDGPKGLGYFARTWRHLLLDWGREQAQLTKGERATLRDGGPAPESSDEAHTVGPASGTDCLRDLPITATGRLVLLCVGAPETISREDIRAAVEESSPESSDRLSRSSDETWTMLDDWRARVANHGLTKGERTRRLVFILRGPPGVIDDASWDEASFISARNWLYKQRQRATERARKRVSVAGGGER